jgi:hypothetical protein
MQTVEMITHISRFMTISSGVEVICIKCLKVGGVHPVAL